tara:strand:+ start:567 stop:806 length:240 start_codon:yes stop_codon:yes gene_type:complete
MSKKEKEPTYKLFDKEYNQEELNALSDEQKTMIQHRDDLTNKINRAEFNLVQMRFGLKAFDDGLRETLNEILDESELGK